MKRFPLFSACRWCLIFAIGFALPVHAFTLSVTNLTPTCRGSVAWGDYDNDGQLDILLTGTTNGYESGAISQVWRNTGNGFSNINAAFPGVITSSAAWADYDNDGRLDILLAGLPSSLIPVSQVWRNTGSGFVNINAGLPGVYRCSVAWGDYDNDGRLDILLTGYNVSNPILSQVWRNTGSGFTNINAGLPGVGFSSAAWGDYDNDGRLDILLTGSTNGDASGVISQVWRNTGNGFTNINAGLPGVWGSSVGWGDYDNDGRLDILLTGGTNSVSAPTDIISQVWRNTGSGFVNVNAGLPGVGVSSAAWGDYDNDGLLDILLTGSTNGIAAAGASQVWRNTGSGFTNINVGLTGVYFSSVAWGDCDNDGRLDILLTGSTNVVANSTQVSQVWRNNTPQTNTPPTAPSGLNATLVGNTLTMTWNTATDAQTSASGLNYNVRIGTTPGGSDVFSPMAGANGLRRIAQRGPKQSLSLVFNYTMGTPYYWSVQAIDTAFAGSPFATEGTFKILQSAPVFVPLTATNVVTGDLNGNGVLDESELNSVLTNYYATSPFLQMTNVLGLGESNVTFAVTNFTANSFSVEYSINLTNWYLLGPATPRYGFTDTNTPGPQRYYRLRWP
jgi:hypothetical protein